jgi:hypothetical protein
LSPCSISFGEQLTWECSELHANETFPEGNLIDPRERYRGIDKLPALLRAKRHSQGEAANKQDIYQTWLGLVGVYSANSLTYRSDIFPAISRLAKCFNDVLQDQYVAGLWREDLIHGLLWFIGDFPVSSVNNLGWRDRTLDHGKSSSP